LDVERDAVTSKTPKNILLIEDDIVDVMAMERLLRRFAMADDYRLHTAANGVEALALLRGEGPDRLEPTPGVIFLDLNMPKMNGFEFLETLRDDPVLWATKVIILTTSDAPEDRAQADNANVAGFITKPITLNQFVEAITTLNRY
jgi:CheY-like chemotaxis protein